MDALTAQLGDMCGLAGIAMEHATQALLQADLPLAERVITDHDRLTAMWAPSTARASRWEFRRIGPPGSADRPSKSTY
jgi:phosphate transport system protein